jgi:hypothetical protein
LVAGGGILGLLLAVDGFIAFLFLLLSSMVSSGPPNPYSGAITFVLLPIVVLIGSAVAWGAWQYWRATSAPIGERADASAR